MKNTKLIESEQFSLSFRDIFKGLIVAILAPVFVIIQSTLDAGELTFDWKAILTSALAAGVAYLLKNFLEPTKVIALTGKESGDFINKAKDLIGNRPNDR